MSIRESLEIEPFIRCHERPTGFIESIRERPRIFRRSDLRHDVEWLVDACEVVLNNCRLLLNDFGWQNCTPDLTYRIEQTIYYELHRLGVADAVGVELVFDGPKLSLNAWPKDTSLNEEIKEEIERRKDRRARGVGTARTVSRNVTMLISGPHCNEVFADWLEDQGLPDQAKACRGATWSSSFGQDQFGVFAELRVGEAVQLFRWIPPGTVSIEAWKQRDIPAKTVTIAKGFWMADTPCTQSFWNEIMGNNPSKNQGSSLELPVETIVALPLFLARLSLCEGVKARLPSEACWKHAYLAGTAGPRYGELDDITWYEKNSGGQTHPVGLKEPNPWGLYDMLGNVWELSSTTYPTIYFDKFHYVGQGGCFKMSLEHFEDTPRAIGPLTSSFVGFRLSIPCS